MPRGFSEKYWLNVVDKLEAEIARLKYVPRDQLPQSKVEFRTGLGMNDHHLYKAFKAKDGLEKAVNSVLNRNAYSAAAIRCYGDLPADARKKLNKQARALNKALKNKPQDGHCLVQGPAVNLSDSLRLRPIEPMERRCYQTQRHEWQVTLEWQGQTFRKGRGWQHKGYLCNACKHSLIRRYQSESVAS